MPAAFKRCVKSVMMKKAARNAYAVCTAANAGGIKEYRKKETAMRRKGRAKKGYA